MAQSTELLVIGAGSGGLGAAIAGARQGLSTVLVEPFEQLGGTSTVGGVNCWEMGAGGTGLPFEIYKRLKRRGAAGVYTASRHFCWQDKFYWPDELDKCCFPGGEMLIDPARRYLDTLRRHLRPGEVKDRAFWQEVWHGVPFEPADFDAVVRRMLRESGTCRILTGRRMVEAKEAAGRVRGVILDDGSEWTARVVVDATADGRLCRALGCEQHLGVDPRSRYGEPGAPAEARHVVNAATLIYRVTPAGTEAVEPLPAEVPEKLWWAANPAPASVNAYPDGDRNVNMLPTMQGAEFVAMDPAEAYAECRRRVAWHWHFIQENFAEFRRYRMKWIAPMLGIREGCRTVCEKMLTENDILQGIHGQADPDIVAVADHALDRHGEGGGCPELNAPYGVPYRCLLPAGWRNLLIACRGAGFSSIAATSCRLSRTMMQLGQAAGNAAALAFREGIDLPEVDADELRGMLQAQHVQLDWPLPDDLMDYLRREDEV